MTLVTWHKRAALSFIQYRCCSTFHKLIFSSSYLDSCQSPIRIHKVEIVVTVRLFKMELHLGARYYMLNSGFGQFFTLIHMPFINHGAHPWISGGATNGTIQVSAVSLSLWYLSFVFRKNGRW